MTVWKLAGDPALGITIAVDDFSTGISMLSCFAKLPVVTLNIERSFVVDVFFAAGGLTRLSGSINLAHAPGSTYALLRNAKVSFWQAGDG